MTNLFLQFYLIELPRTQGCIGASFVHSNTMTPCTTVSCEKLFFMSNRVKWPTCCPFIFNL